MSVDGASGPSFRWVCYRKTAMDSSADTFGLTDFAAPLMAGNFTSIKPGRLKLPALCSQNLSGLLSSVRGIHGRFRNRDFGRRAGGSCG